MSLFIFILNHFIDNDCIGPNYSPTRNIEHIEETYLPSSNALALENKSGTFDKTYDAYELNSEFLSPFEVF